MKLELNKGDALLIQSSKSTIKVVVDQTGLIGVTELD